MKATIDLPDDLYRRVKARSAMEGRSVRAVAMDLFRQWLGETVVDVDQAARHERLSRFRGIVDSGVSDLATNPDYLEDFGLAAPRDR